MDTPFPNVTLDDIENSLPLLGGSLTGDLGIHTQSDDENDRTLQARVEIETVEIYSKVGKEVSSSSCNLNLSVDNCKEEYYYVTS